MSQTNRPLARLLAATLCLDLASAEPMPPCLDKGKARVVLVGDSITGLSRNAHFGFAHALEAAVKATYPESEPQIIALGGSGQSVSSWLGIEKKARTENVSLDVRGIDVKTTLDQPVDVLVIMLGMNDVLAPYVDHTPASLDRWQENYRQLVAALRERVKPRVFGLASITPCTEDPASPKNRLIKALNEQVQSLATETGARYLATSETVWEIFRQGRTRQPDFHVTYDFVHPNAAGHLGIAIGMLDGLGEAAAADWLRTERLAKLWTPPPPATQPAMSWQLVAAEPTETPGRFRFRLRYWWTAADAEGLPPQVELAVPADWQATPARIAGTTGEFSAVGVPDRVRNLLTLTGQVGDELRQATVVLPAPWLVAAKLILPHWNGNLFDSDKARTAVDERIETGGDFTAAVDLGKGQTLLWQPLFPSVDYTGLDDPASVDFAAATHAANFEAGYAARRLHSDHDRPVKLEIGSRMFAGTVHLTVWLNGQKLYDDNLAKTTVDAQLQKGWNTLAFKASHRTWQWQVMVGLAGVDDDTLEDLRYALPELPVAGRPPQAP